MRLIAAIIATTISLGACGRASTPPPVDSAAVAQRVADSILADHTQKAHALADSAKRTLAVLLKNPASATFDSLIVAQAEMKDGNWPEPAVCGRMGGKPGIKGVSGMTPFIYINRQTVFVLESNNAAPFGGLHTTYCSGPGVRLLMKE